MATLGRKMKNEMLPVVRPVDETLPFESFGVDEAWRIAGGIMRLSALPVTVSGISGVYRSMLVQAGYGGGSNDDKLRCSVPSERTPKAPKPRPATGFIFALPCRAHVDAPAHLAGIERCLSTRSFTQATNLDGPHRRILTLAEKGRLRIDSRVRSPAAGVSQ